jgi:hypothetical protein
MIDELSRNLKVDPPSLCSFLQAVDKFPPYKSVTWAGTNGLKGKEPGGEGGGQDLGCGALQAETSHVSHIPGLVVAPPVPKKEEMAVGSTMKVFLGAHEPS